MFNALTPMHIILIVVVALLLFGPSKLPELGRGFGKMFREFKDATSGNSGSSSDELPREPEAPKKELAAAPVQVEAPQTHPTSGK
ncbi:twin-arginine translocase TatA/TatE family subunit [Paenibacillus allorhizosphaerae]|uniref:Sec-independent protein translocase protein TatA n=1 Tax=Paenibacillus allorhizosphaerae TaxID=2849866 RepID=A0ABM8VMZ9_9BACL|nr:twin-arginine translocase TatA/TatE family subunit [Paenibacillus allorhizosphaerae]CAG7650747.1 Sec-independent protein translocase protein TatA [Paenibacillus allorhizosphaerae]